MVVGGQGGLRPRRYWLSLPLWCAEGWLALSSPDLTAVSLFYAPYPPYPPSPAGKGEPQSLFRRGLRPRHPGAEPLTALTDIAVPVPYVGKPAVRRKSEGKRLPIVFASAAPRSAPGMQGAKPLA